MDTKKLLILLFIISLFIRIVAIFIAPVKIWDETVYANLGYDLSFDPLDYSFRKKWSDFVPGDPPFAWPNAGYRAPLLPYTLSLFYVISSSEIFISLFIPVIGALTVIVIYFLSKELFNEKIALYSSLLLTFLPLHIIFSGKILTDVFATFLLTLSFLFFWKGFEKGENKYKLLFGFSIALSLLARYTTLWLLIIFPLYLIIKYRNLSFLRDKHLWFCIAIFIISLLPLFFYGISAYNNPIGVFTHARIAADYWGGSQPWDFFFQHSRQMFAILTLLFPISLFLIFIDKELRKKPQTILIILWFFIFFIFVHLMSHKEDRFLLPMVPSLIIISSVALSKFKKYSKIIVILVALILLYRTISLFHENIEKSYTQTHLCFLEANYFLKDVEKNALVITDESSIIYFYTKLETHFYPNPFGFYSLRNLIKNYYSGRPVYIFFSTINMPLSIQEYKEIKEILDSSFEVIFRCPENGNMSVIYRYE